MVLLFQILVVMRAGFERRRLRSLLGAFKRYWCGVCLLNLSIRDKPSLAILCQRHGEKGDGEASPTNNSIFTYDPALRLAALL